MFGAGLQKELSSLPFSRKLRRRTFQNLLSQYLIQSPSFDIICFLAWRFVKLGSGPAPGIQSITYFKSRWTMSLSCRYFTPDKIELSEVRSR